MCLIGMFPKCFRQDPDIPFRAHRAWASSRFAMVRCRSSFGFMAPAPRAAEVRAGGLSPQNPLRSSNVERHCTLKPDTIPELSAHCCQEKEIECAVVRMARTVKLAVIKKELAVNMRTTKPVSRSTRITDTGGIHDI